MAIKQFFVRDYIYIPVYIFKGIFDPTGVSYCYNKVENIKENVSKASSYLTEEEKKKLEDKRFLSKGNSCLINCNYTYKVSKETSKFNSQKYLK